MQKRWYRNTKQAWLGGVVAGLADYFQLDPLLFRIGVIGITLATAIIPGIICYLVAWYIVPVMPSKEAYQYEG